MIREQAMLDHLSDRQLATLCADGVDLAFDILAARHRPALLGQCARLLAHADAEEAVQETLLRAYVALSRGHTVRRVGPWLRAIARHTAINVIGSGQPPPPSSTRTGRRSRRRTGLSAASTSATSCETWPLYPGASGRRWSCARSRTAAMRRSELDSASARTPSDSF